MKTKLGGGAALMPFGTARVSRQRVERDAEITVPLIRLPLAADIACGR